MASHISTSSSIFQNHPESIVYIGVGSNVGNSKRSCIEAIENVIADTRSSFLAMSSLYKTSPVSGIAQRDYVNCAFAVSWSGSPRELLHFLKNIELRMGRKNKVTKGARIIDLDVLIFGNIIIKAHDLTIPHAELHKRKFALMPCLEINPALVHPLYNKPLQEFLYEAESSQEIMLLERPPDYLMQKKSAHGNETCE